ncbi:hypothetical protein [Hymenobacter jeollabukensis]|uniref:Colicin D immunity protein domain-containing protein n=1 Tax=Hymenobacter jeollabukensis TaxID=2025313 RepID=A0A5R8WPX9_9BACT|nr:hypothetical protein [Hymenobacter jeollabukensis]TLM91792.1 hypothetical protein FDY95_14635 [Hymenobacter jeollabukensis]
MDLTSWTERVVAAIGDVADLVFQQRAWLGTGPEISSFVETYCTLYDDNAFAAFLAQQAWPQTGLAPAVRQEMILLDQLLRAYQEPGSDAEILADPRWREVAHQAQRVLQAIEEGASK